MKNENNLNPIRGPSDPWARVAETLMRAPRHTFVALLLVAALFAFEIFNFDTTKYALSDLLGEVSLLGISWASVLGFAFCAIDFAGLVRIFTPEQGKGEHKEVWYLMGAWLLGATMNAVMTWYAVSLTLLHRPLQSSEVLSPEQLLTVVPIFVAILVWLTRILFIGALSMAGEQIFAVVRAYEQEESYRTMYPQRPMPSAPPIRQQSSLKPSQTAAQPVMRRNQPEPVYVNDMDQIEPKGGFPSSEQPGIAPSQRVNRVRQRPPLSGGRTVAPMSAKERR